MPLQNVLDKAFRCAAAYISLENCRACKRTVNNLHPLEPPQSLCIQCWHRLQKTCTATSSIKLGSVSVQAAGIHSGLLRKLIIRLKQTKDPLLAYDLVQLAIKDCAVHIQTLDNYLIIPMPLHKKRLRHRGFNQSELLARELSFLLKMQLSTNALKRTKDTRSQRGLHKEERWQNMQHAFAARHNIVRNKTIVLVDDVHTSGATMQAAAAALLEAEAAFVAGICIAEAPLYKQLSGYESTSAKQGCLPSTLFLKPAQPFL